MAKSLLQVRQQNAHAKPVLLLCYYRNCNIFCFLSQQKNWESRVISYSTASQICEGARAPRTARFGKRNPHWKITLKRYFGLLAKGESNMLAGVNILS